MVPPGVQKQANKVHLSSETLKKRIASPSASQYDVLVTRVRSENGDAEEKAMSRRKSILIASVGAICAALLASTTPASAASLNVIDSSDYASILGTEVDSVTSTIDGIDGTITSTVYEGTGSASGYYVYTYSIELSDTSVSSIDSVMFEFGSTPVVVAGIGDSFAVDDGSGNIAPTSAYYIQSSETAGFEFEVNLAAGETSTDFGLFSAVAPATTEADVSGATRTGGRRAGRSAVAAGGTATVLSNGVAPVPEPTAAFVFAIGFAVIAARCGSKASRA